MTDSADKQSIAVEDNPQQPRYEIRVGGGLAGAIYYELQGDTIVVDHTEIEQRFEGQGLGSQLARQALDDMRRRGLRVLPFCAFVRSYIARHGEYLDLVPEEQRAAFGL